MSYDPIVKTLEAEVALLRELVALLLEQHPECEEKARALQLAFEKARSNYPDANDPRRIAVAAAWNRLIERPEEFEKLPH